MCGLNGVDIAKVLGEAAHQCAENGWVPGSSGNISLRIGDRMYISVTGAPLDRLRKEDIAVVGMTDGSFEGERAPSKEWAMHYNIYQTRPDIKAVLHIHGTDCIAAGLLLEERKELPFYVPAHYIKMGRVKKIALLKAGSPKLAEAVAEAYKDQRVNSCLLLRHGAIIGGTNMKNVLMRAEYLTEACRLHMQFKGQYVLSDSELEEYIRV